MKKLIHFLQFIAAVILTAPLAALPLRPALRIGQWLGDALFFSGKAAVS